MKVTKKLLLLSLLNIAVMTGLWILKPSGTIQELSKVLHGEMWADSAPFMQEAWRVERLGQPVYQTVFFQEHLKFQYPMSSLLLGYVTLAFGVSFQTLLIWLTIPSALLTLWLAGDLFVRVLPMEPAERLLARLLVMSLGLFFYPLANGLQITQIQTVLTFLFTLAVWLWLTERKVTAGICLALACAVKPPLGLFLLWGLLRREWRFVSAFLATLVVVQGLSVGLFGWSNNIAYLGPLSYMGHHGECIGENQSVNGWLQRLLRNGEGSTSMFAPYNRIVYLGTVLSSLLLVAVGLVVPVWRRWRDPVGDFLFFGLLSTIASPIVWTHHYGVFYIGTIYLLAVFLRDEQTIPVALGVCFVVLANLFHLLGRFYWIPSVNWVFSYGLYAGMGIILIFLRKYERYGLGKLK
ncbi:glycosyltransferase family 87 protein [Granulicella paludicola]|uniref:glycosyltransferase family 87 protein n=1 Tax=Granulicella paludicola TaxID=474951 RepID=UPI0021E03AF4|nr:glycosyltransferase family 87 protein [Granulicella paludicola]